MEFVDDTPDIEAKLRYLESTLAPAGNDDPVRRIETHMSWVLLGGERVLKLKKPVHYPFLDFTTAQARERNARKELRLNRRLAPRAYLGLLALQLDGDVFSLASPSARRLQLWVAGLMLLCGFAHANPVDPGVDALVGWSEQFAREVDHRLDVPPAAQQQYVLLLRQALTEANLPDPAAQAFLLVDRSAQVQAAFILLRTKAGGWYWVGATAVSTGKTGSFEHFLTPLGVFAHSLDNPDFRAQGTFNKNHIRGYGLRGMRVFDFGWQVAERGWGDGGTSKMRLQMHATDPRMLEPHLGRVASEGCIRIPATLNVFLDRHGILDADYEQAQADGKVQWVLKRDRQTIAWPGRYMVIIDSKAIDRPPWSPLPNSTSSLNIAPEVVAMRPEYGSPSMRCT